MSDNKFFHMGTAVYEVFLKSGMTPEQFADKIGCARGNVYNIFKRQSINAEQLVLISRALNHNFLLDLAKLVDENVSLPVNYSEDDSNFNENMVTLPSQKLLTVNDETYVSIIEEYITTEHHRPLIVIAYNTNHADDLLYKKAEEHYGSKGYKVMTDTVNLEVRPYKVPVFMEQSERICGKDLDAQIGDVVAAQQKSDKHLVFIVNIPACRLMFDAPYKELENEITQIYEVWNDRAHIVCLDSTGKLTARRHLKRYNGYTANHIIAWDFIEGLTYEHFKDSTGKPFDRQTVFDSIENLVNAYHYLVETKQVTEVDFDFSKMSVKKYENYLYNGQKVWIIHFPDILDPSQDAIRGIVETVGSKYYSTQVMLRPEGYYVLYREGTFIALDPYSPVWTPHFPEIPTDEELLDGAFNSRSKFRQYKRE